jgi:ribose 5-phosphate isomerase A
VEPFDQLTELDLVIDGADQMTPEGWLNKGRGAAHTREKILATAAKRFVIIADSTKAVSMLQSPVPVELLEFGLPATLRRLEPIQLRNVSRSPDGGVIADYYGPLTSPASVTAWLESHSGLIEHGLFPPGLVTEAFVGRGDSVQRIIFPNVRQ